MRENKGGGTLARLVLRIYCLKNLVLGESGCIDDVGEAKIKIQMGSNCPDFRPVDFF